MRLRAAAALLLTAGALHAGSTITVPTAAVATPSPYATTVAVSVLKRGGSAMDAAVAAAFTLGVVSPHATGIGGGGFLVYYDAASKAAWTLDFRETAPGSANAHMFERPADAHIGAHAAGVPGTVAGLAAAHGRFGKRPWKELVDPAIALATDGFPAGAELHAALAGERQARKIDQFPTTAALFFPAGQALASGARLIQPELAATLTRVAGGGAQGFYEGETAKRLVESSRAAGGSISYRDLSGYQAMWRAPVKIAAGDYEVFTVPPPSAGGVILAETLNIISALDAVGTTAKAIHLRAEAERRAFVDAARYLADPAMARVPYRDLLSAERASRWRNSVDPSRATPTVTLSDVSNSAPQHTAHISVVDAAGSLAALTVSLGDELGSGFVVPGCGFILNDAMASFADDGVNAIEPGKRPLSFATPAVLLRGTKPLLAIGASGGAAIPSTMLQVLLTVASGRSLPVAIAEPRYRHQGTPEEIYYEDAPGAQSIIESLTAMGHGVRLEKSPASVNAVMVAGEQVVAVADPRYGGAAGGY